jgi:hypothetical protein
VCLLQDGRDASTWLLSQFALSLTTCYQHDLDISMILVDGEHRIVASSVEDERLFSAASFESSKNRRRLDKSLVNCVRGKVQSVFSSDTFPDERALALWKAAKPSRGRYLDQKE